MSQKGQRQRRRRVESAPPSGQKPSKNLAPRDLEVLAEELVAYHELLADLFARREQREWSEFYLRGQLSKLERKTVEPRVLALKGPDPAAVRAGQQFLGEGAWSDKSILARHQRLVGEGLGQPEGVVIVDGSGPSILQYAGEGGQLPARSLCRLCQFERLHVLGSALVHTPGLV